MATSSSLVDDISLIARIAHRDQLALSSLYDRYARIIQAIAFKSLKSIEESEEIVLDVFTQVWRIAERYDAQKSQVDTWLFMLARSRILDQLRKKQRNVPSIPVIIDDKEIQIAADSVDLIEEAIIAERRDRVSTVLAVLPKEQRLVIELAYYQGLTHSQISAETGMSLGTVKTRIRLGLNKLKSALDVGS